jgi:hypothetical protein
VNGEQIPAAIDLSMNVFLAQTSFDGHRNVCFNVPITGMKIYIGGKVGGQFEGDTSIAGTNIPTRRQGRTRERASLDAPVPGSEFQRVESSSPARARNLPSTDSIS